MPNINRPSITLQTNGIDNRTINSGGYNAIPVISGTTTLTPNIILSNATISATNGTLALKGPNNWSDLNNIELNNGTVDFAYTDTQAASQTYSGDASLCSLIGNFIPYTVGQIVSSLNQLQPAQLKAFAVAQENNAVKVIDSLGGRFQRELDSVHCMKGKEVEGKNKPCKLEAKPFHVWVNGMGDALHQSSTTYAGSPQFGYQENMGDVSAGMDYHFAKYLYIGALGAYTSSDLTWNDHQGTGDIQTGYAGPYLSCLGKMFYGNAAVIRGWSHYNAHRKINLPFENLTAKSSHGGSQILSHLDTDINLGFCGFTIRPFDSFDYISQTENSFTEKGAGILNLSIEKSNPIMLRNELGLNFATCFCIKGSQWTISPKISWVREVRVKGDQMTAEFINTENPFTVTGYFPDRSLVSPGVSITGNMMHDLLTVGLYYNGEFKGTYSDHSYGGQIRFGF